MKCNCSGRGECVCEYVCVSMRCARQRGNEALNEARERPPRDDGDDDDGGGGGGAERARSERWLGRLLRMM